MTRLTMSTTDTTFALGFMDMRDLQRMAINTNDTRVTDQNVVRFVRKQAVRVDRCIVTEKFAWAVRG